MPESGRRLRELSIDLIMFRFARDSEDLLRYLCSFHLS